MSYRLGILSSHPIQYQAPWFRRLAQEPQIDLKVLFCHLPDAACQGQGFGVDFVWDIPLLDGYAYEVLENVARRPGTARFSGCDTPAIGERIRANKLDVLLINGWNVKSYLQGLRACRRLGVPCLVRGDSNALRRRPWWKRLLHRRWSRCFTAYLTVGKSNEDFYRQNGASDTRFFPVRHFVDNERFAQAARELRVVRDDLRRGWGIASDRTVFLFCGKFIEQKRPLDFLRALEIALHKGAPVHGLLVGDGKLRGDCETMVRQRRLPATFVGFLNQRDLPRAYVAADCLVLPSDDRETWGLVVNEAMASGLSCVVSDRVGCGPDLIVKGATGHVFPFGDCDALASILAQLSANPERLRSMGEAAEQQVSSYSVDAAVEGTLAAVRFACGRRASTVGSGLR